jgi:hypothetical protein
MIRRTETVEVIMTVAANSKAKGHAEAIIPDKLA